MNASDILKYGDLTWLGAVKTVPDNRQDESGVCGFWSAKDLFAHIVSYELMLADVLAQQLGKGEPTPTLDHFLGKPASFNNAEVENRENLSWQAVWDEYTAVHQRVMALIAEFTPEKLREPGVLPWYGTEYSLDDFIVYTNYGHKREHSAQIDAYLDRLRG